MVLEALLAVLVSVAIASLLLAVAGTATILFIARMVALLFAFTARMIMCLCTSACPGIDPDLANLGARKLAEHGISPGVFATAWAAWGLGAVRVLRRLAQRMWSGLAAALVCFAIAVCCAPARRARRSPGRGRLACAGRARQTARAVPAGAKSSSSAAKARGTQWLERATQWLLMLALGVVPVAAVDVGPRGLGPEGVAIIQFVRLLVGGCVVLGFAWGVGFRAKKGLTGEHEVPGVHETVEAVVSGVAATVNQVEPSSPQWAGQIFIKRTGRRTFVLNVTSDDTVASVKARLKWRNSRLVHLPQELCDDTRSLGSYGVRKEDTLLLFGRLCGGAPASEAKANEVAQKHAKLCLDPSGLIKKGKFGGIDMFDSTLEEQVGYMDANALRGMYAEHCMDAASSNAPFSPPNNPGLECTPEGEFWYVVGKDGIDIDKWEVKPGARPSTYDGCMVEGRNATPLSELLEADEAKRAKLRDTELIALRLYSGKNSFAGRRYGGVVVSILLHLPFLAMP